MGHERSEIRLVSGGEVGSATQGSGGNQAIGQRTGTPPGGVEEFRPFSASAGRSGSTSGNSVPSQGPHANTIASASKIDLSASVTPSVVIAAGERAAA